MPPKVKVPITAPQSNEPDSQEEDHQQDEFIDQSQSRSLTPVEVDFTQHEKVAIFFKDAGLREFLDNDRKSDVFTIIGFGSTGERCVAQAWDTYAKSVADYFKTNHMPGGQVYIFPNANDFQTTDPCFRAKAVSPYLARAHKPDVSLNFQIGEGERINYKDPARMIPESMPVPVPLDEFDGTKAYVIRDGVRHDILHPTRWESLHQEKGSDLPASFVSSPVKKRTFKDLMSMSNGAPHSPSKMMSPIKTEPVSSSSSSSGFAGSKSALFNPLNKNK